MSTPPFPGWIQIAPGVWVPPNIANSPAVGGSSNPVVAAAQQAAAAAAAQQAANAAAARQNAAQADLNRRIGEGRARRRATLRSLQILRDEKKKKKGKGAQVSKGETGEVKKKRTTAALRIGGTGAAPGGGLNIAV